MSVLPLQRLLFSWIAAVRHTLRPHVSKHSSPDTRTSPRLFRQIAPDPTKGASTPTAIIAKTETLQTRVSPTRLSVYFFREFRVFLGDKPVPDWPSRKAKFIFAYLALNHQRKICRDVLMERFWPNAKPESARNCLNVTLHGLRRLLHSIDDTLDHILFQSECYFFNPALRFWLDVDEFKIAWKEGQARERRNKTNEALHDYERAAKIYVGDFMEESPYDDWVISQREHLREVYLVLLDKISSYYSQDGQPQLSIALCEQMLEKDACQEEVYRRLMRCYYRLGARDKALKQFQRCREIIKKELDVPPMNETVKLYEQIKKGMD